MIPKLKNENYTNFGGINQKSSLYITGQTEFLKLHNVDFRLFGSLSSFAGSTQVSIVASTSPITGIADYYTSYFDGTTFSLNTQSFAVITTDGYNVCNASGNTFVPVLPYILPGNLNPVNFVLASSSVAGSTVNGALFGCNGWDFFNYQGSTVAWQFSLGKPVVPPISISRGGSGGAGLSGYLVMYYSLIRSDGLYGPALAQTYTVFGDSAISFLPPSKPNLNILPGGAGTGLSFGSFGLSGIQAWLQFNQGIPLAITPPLGLTTSAAGGFTVPYFFTAMVGGPTTGFSYGIGASWFPSIPQPADFQGSFLYGLGSTQGSDGAINISPGNPYIVEYFANQLFTAGFGNFPSRVVYSNPGTPEIAAYSNFFDVAPNEPVPISGMKTYFTTLGIWKPNSTWALSGTGPDTFVLTEVSSQYGLISSRAVCVWNQNCWFLDRKGICQFNGANVEIISTKVEPYFQRMNVQAAVTQAVMIHVKERNEVWTAIPIDGSSVNNLIVVFDYVANAWTTRTCPPGTMTALALLTQGQNKQTPYFGTSTGIIGTFGNSFIGDNGAAFTSLIKSRFIDDLGQSVTKLYRRLFLDATVPQGSTYNIAVNFYADKGTSAALQTTMTLSSFQNRMEIGIAAKSLSVEFVYNGAQFLQINGYTLEYRFQRAV